jgi:hypothetical protein
MKHEIQNHMNPYNSSFFGIEVLGLKLNFFS